jgi:hypothetical protein
MGTQDGCLYAITPEMECAWKYATGDMINHCAPAIAPDGTIYIGSCDHCLYALTPAGRLKWKFVTGRPVAASPAIAADGTIYFGSQDTHLYALYPDGQKKWELQADSPFASSPVITVEGTVVICTQNRTVLALAEENGGAAQEGWPLLAGNPQRSGRQALSGRQMTSPRLALALGRLREAGQRMGWCCSSPPSTPTPASGVDFSRGHRVRPAEIRRTRCLFSMATG